MRRMRFRSTSPLPTAPATWQACDVIGHVILTLVRRARAAELDAPAAIVMACNSLVSRPMLEVCARRAVPMLLALVLAPALPAAATTFVRMDVPELARRSDAAVIGVVRAMHAQAAPGGAISTRVILVPEHIVHGTLPPGELALEEPGGRLGGVVEHVFGAPEYRVGERVLVFVRRTPRGTLRTTGMAMGRYALDAGAEPLARRDAGDAVVLDPTTGRPRPLAAEPLADLLRALPAKPVREVPARPAPRVPRRVTGVPVPFTYLGDPSRWFEPDEGLPVHLHIDAIPDASLGEAVTRQAVEEALAAWNGVAGSSLQLAAGVLEAPLPFAGCEGDSRVVFNDPFDEIEPPDDCRGVLGVGGYCYTDERREVGGRLFQRIRLGKVVIADGWGGCPQWTPCNLAEVITHEIGHAVGLGHSDDETATMAGTADFDGRCAALAADDITGVTSIYPLAATATPTTTPSPTWTPSAPPEATPTTERSMTPTAPPVGARGVRGQVRYYASGIPVPGVELTLRGPAPRDALSRSNGDYAVDRLEPGTWELAPLKHGDYGTAVTTLDAAWVLQASAGRRTLDGERALACDVTGSGSITPVDARRILDFALGRVRRLPAGERCGSDFVFFPDPATIANQPIGVRAPRLGPESCIGGALRYTPLLGQLTDQDFRAALIGDCTGDWRPAERRATRPQLAPDGTALSGATLRRLRGPLWRMTVGVLAPDEVHALDVEVRFDPGRITPRRVRAVHLGSAALIDSVRPAADRFVIALASAIPLPADGRAVLAIDFIATGPAIASDAARAWSARVDDRQVAVVVP